MDASTLLVVLEYGNLGVVLLLVYFHVMVRPLVSGASARLEEKLSLDRSRNALLVEIRDRVDMLIQKDPIVP